MSNTPPVAVAQEPGILFQQSRIYFVRENPGRDIGHSDRLMRIGRIFSVIFCPDTQNETTRNFLRRNLNAAQFEYHFLNAHRTVACGGDWCNQTLEGINQALKSMGTVTVLESVIVFTRDPHAHDILVQAALVRAGIHGEDLGFAGEDVWLSRPGGSWDAEVLDTGRLD